MKTKLTKRVIDAINPDDKDIIAWDTELAGLGIRCRRGGNKFYVVKYRCNGRQRWLTLGRHGPLTVDIARREARKLLGDIARGHDPAELRDEGRRTLTVTQLCDLYRDEGCTTKKPSTVMRDVSRIERHIKPLLGKYSVSSIKRADVERLLADVAAGKTATDVRTGPRGRAIVTGGQGAATATVVLFKSIMSFAVARELRPDNPARGVRTYKPRRFERFLLPAELARLGDALTEAESDGANPFGIAALRLLALTGCRKGEVTGLRWAEVDFEHRCLRLTDSKTGGKVVALGAPARSLLANLPRLAGSPWVFPATSGDGHYAGLQRLWENVRARADLGGVRLHDLRHSYASIGVAGGDSLYVIGHLLGHTRTTTTQRYAHIGDDPLKAAAERISSVIDAHMRGQGGAEILELERKR